MTTRARSRSAILALALFVGTQALAPAVIAAEKKSQSQAAEAGENFGIGLVAVLANLVYMPVKTCFGLLGAVTGSLAYVLSGANREVADGVWVPSLGGDYVLTTDMMMGREPVRFSGVRPRPSSPEDDEEASESGF